jgi:hypothetical protein
VATWSGWQDQLLKAAGLPTSSDNETFLSDWNKSADSNCQNNPVDISHATSGSTNCKKLTTTRTAQNYAGHAGAASAFRAEIQSGNYPHLRAALASGKPYNVSDSHDVIGDLIVWGSEKFAFELTNNYGQPQPQPPTGGQIRAPHALGGWGDMQRSVNRNLPATLKQSNRYTVRALQSLARARKVRL